MSKAKPANPSEDITKAPPMALGPEKSVLSSILQEPAKYMKLALNEGVVSDDFYVMSHRYLFEFLLKLWNAEQEIELVSLVQRLLDNGLLDKVGGPSSVSDLYTYAAGHAHFSLHLGQVKDKAVLREIIRKANQQIREAYEQPESVRELVEKCASDASEIQAKTESRASDFKRYKTQIVTADSMKEEARSYLNGDSLLGGDPFFLEGFDFNCRKHETTLWVGTSFHGKSRAVQNQIAALAARGRRSVLASFEQEPAITMGQILASMTAYKDIAKSDEYDAAWAYVNSMISIYKTRKRTTAKSIVETFRQAYLSEGVDTMVVDNFTTLAVDRSDNSAIAEACDVFRVFVAEYPVHFHCVVHPRKNSNDAKANPNKPPTQADIRGAAELGDLASNVGVVWRDMEKSRKLEEMMASGATKYECGMFYNSTPCGFISLEKQRFNGKMPKRQTWFDDQVGQFTVAPNSSKPFFSGAPPWES